MSPETGMRLLWALGLMAGGLLAYNLVTRALIARTAGKINTIPAYRPGLPAILYFTTPMCVPCKTIQRPALQMLQKQLGEQLQVIEVDASIQTDLASHWGVMSVPTTFLIDSTGQSRHVNHGVANIDKLQNQLKLLDL